LLVSASKQYLHKLFEFVAQWPGTDAPINRLS